MNVTRRQFLQDGSLVVAGSLLAGVAPAPWVGKTPPFPRVQRMAERPDLPLRTDTAPELAPLNVIVLNRLGFGARPPDWAAYNALGSTPAARFSAYLAQQLNPAAIADGDCDQRLAAQNFVTLAKPLTQLWADHTLADDYDTFSLPYRETVQATWIRALYSKRQFFEVLADFWHNHFNLFGWHDGVVSVFVHYDRDVIRANALGNFRQMLEAVATSPAMLYYLDNAFSSDDGPNENWARELFELHTLGVENYLGPLDQAAVPGYSTGNPTAYVDNDVYEAARAFTGWRVRDDDYDPEVGNTGEFFTYTPWHDRFQKTVLGLHLRNDRPALEDGRAVLDAVAGHPATARYLCTKLCRRFIADNPPQAVIDAAVAVWTANQQAPDQIKRVLQTILTSNEFANTWGEKVKRPFEFVASALRAVDAEWAWSDGFQWTFAQLGQALFEWPPPNGYPDRHEAWTGTNVMLGRWTILTYCLEGWLDDISADLLSQMPGNIRTPIAICDFWIARLLGRAMGTDDRQELIEFVAQGRNPEYDLSQELIDERVPRLVELIIMFPDFQWR